MTINTEIEYKSMLHEKEYQQLINYFSFTPKDFFMQTNIYFDTPKEELKKMHAGLRIRINDDKAEQTLKIPQKIGLLEITTPISVEEAKKDIDTGKITPTGQVLLKLQQLNINYAKLEQMGQLTTKRAEKLLGKQLIVLDESWYGGKHDFELEIEVDEENTGYLFFTTFLKQHKLPYRPAKNKVQRMLEQINI